MSGGEGRSATEIRPASPASAPSALPIEFWFDFSSGYAYFAAHTIDILGERHGREVIWRPYMLGVAFKQTGARGLSGTPIKGDYARRDWARLAKMTGRGFDPPENHPITALPASRAYYWIEEHFPTHAHEFARRAFRAYFGAGYDMTTPTNVAADAETLGLPAAEIEAGIGSAPIKERVKRMSEEALERPSSGRPSFSSEMNRSGVGTECRCSKNGWKTLVGRGRPLILPRSLGSPKGARPRCKS